MTRVDFYLLNGKQTHRDALFACRLAEKAYKQGHKILLHTEDEQQASHINDLLWTWRQGSFIPHELLQPGETPDCPVVINHRTDAETAMQDVLINLASEIPLFFSQFDRVAEIVDPDEQKRLNARQRYRFYQERGYPLDTHEMDA